jgi:hypothetical protein
MKSILKIALLLLMITFQPACERDDICLEEITPKLVIRFYNNEIPGELRSVFDLKVNIEGVDGDYVNGTIKQSTDSISIPLNVDKNSTRIILTLMGDEAAGIEDNPDTIALTYSQEDVFISRSCGYKTLFNEAEISLFDDDDNWIKKMETRTEPLQITDENNAHVKIFH